MSNEFISGTFDAGTRSDCRICYIPGQSGGIEIHVNSKVKVMYGDSIYSLAQKTLAELAIAHCVLRIDDGGALPFVIQARIEAAIKMAHPELKLTSLPEMKPHCMYSTTRDRFRRSRLYIPGVQPKFMLNAGIHQPDSIILDLEDSVAPSEKLSARLIVRNALRTLNFFGAERTVRINQGALGIEDIKAVVPQNVHVLLIPKVENAQQVEEVDRKAREVAAECGRREPVFLMPILESGLGILNALSIACASENNVALAIGLEDYTADIGTQRTKGDRESFFARSTVVNAARAAGLQPIDTVFSDVDDMEGLRESVLEAKALGFDGKGCIHPRQIRTIHEAFAPSQVEIEKAKKIVLAFDEARAKGLGVVSLGSKMIDPPVVKRALRTVDLAMAMGLLPKEWKLQTVEAKS